MTITIEQVVDKIEAWRDKEVAAQRLYGGLTNSNYRVDAEGKAFGQPSRLRFQRLSLIFGAGPSNAGLGPKPSWIPQSLRPG